jgi:hypothetical protein
MFDDARSAARGERLDAMRGTNELSHDGQAADHEHDVEHARARSAEIEQGGDRPRTGERRAEHLGADQDGGADDGDNVKPVDAAALSHVGLLREAQSLRIRLRDQARTAIAGLTRIVT